MFRWQKLASEVSDSPSKRLRTDVGNPEAAGNDGTSSRHHSSSKKSLWVLMALAFVLISMAFIFLGWYWSREPALFSVNEHVQQSSSDSLRPLQPGYTLSETLKKISSTLLDKSGGYLSNDIAPPGVFLDNMQSWEFGVLVQIRDITRALRRDFARSQSQSTEDFDLSRAEPQFNFDNAQWVMPSTETEYRQGIKQLDDYVARLSLTGDRKAIFYARADNLNNWLADVSTRLGSLSQRLSASVGKAALGATPDAEQSDWLDVQTNQVKTPFTLIDNVFYEARGQSWALVHLMRAVEVDFHEVLVKKNALISIQQIVRELEATQASMWSPVILNGDGFGIFANHSLVMANYISRANAAIIELRMLLNQG